MRRQPAASAFNCNQRDLLPLCSSNCKESIWPSRTTRLYAIHLVDNTVVCGYVLGSRISARIAEARYIMTSPIPQAMTPIASAPCFPWKTANTCAISHGPTNRVP